MSNFFLFGRKTIPSLYTQISRGKEDKVYPNYGCVLVAFFIASCFSKKRWYQLALLSTYISRFPYWVIHKHKRSMGLIQASHLNRLLSLLTRTGKQFYIPYSNIGLADIQPHTRLIFCTVHLPLVHVAIRALLEHGIHLDGAIVGVPIKDNLMTVWGLSQKINALTRNNHVLVRAKTLLANNGNIVLMIDMASGNSYSPNIMHFGGMLGAKIVFFFSELTPDGTILNTFYMAPNPYCRNELQIQENISFLKNKHNEILTHYRLQ